MIKRSLFLMYLTALLSGCGKAPKPAPLPARPQRIISLAPNITETLFALGVGDRVVGVTSACEYPEEAKALPHVGGFGQFSDEAIVKLSPDLVILHHEYSRIKQRLNRLGIPYLATGSISVSKILQTTQDIGAACNATPEADKLIRKLKTRIEELQQETPDPPKVLLTFGGGVEANGPIHAFGSASLHSELLELAGGRNVVEAQQPYVMLSKEAVLRYDPDLIIELAPDGTGRSWSSWPQLQAVKNKRVHIFKEPYILIPGPRFINLLEDMNRLIGKTP